jgi:hypothetical protein
MNEVSESDLRTPEIYILYASDLCDLGTISDMNILFINKKKFDKSHPIAVK